MAAASKRMARSDVDDNEYQRKRKAYGISRAAPLWRHLPHGGRIAMKRINSARICSAAAASAGK